MKLSKATLTFAKYIVWTAVSAGLAAVITNLGGLHVPTILIPIVAAMLKSIATYVATQAEDNKPDKD